MQHNNCEERKYGMLQPKNEEVPAEQFLQSTSEEVFERNKWRM